MTGRPGAQDARVCPDCRPGRAPDLDRLHSAVVGVAREDRLRARGDGVRLEQRVGVEAARTAGARCERGAEDGLLLEVRGLVGGKGVDEALRLLQLAAVHEDARERGAERPVRVARFRSSGVGRDLVDALQRIVPPAYEVERLAQLAEDQVLHRRSPRWRAKAIPASACRIAASWSPCSTARNARLWYARSASAGASSVRASASAPFHQRDALLRPPDRLVHERARDQRLDDGVVQAIALSDRERDVERLGRAVELAGEQAQPAELGGDGCEGLVALPAERLVGALGALERLVEPRGEPQDLCDSRRHERRTALVALAREQRRPAVVPVRALGAARCGCDVAGTLVGQLAPGRRRSPRARPPARSSAPPRGWPRARPPGRPLRATGRVPAP